MRTPIVLKW